MRRRAFGALLVLSAVVVGVGCGEDAHEGRAPSTSEPTAERSADDTVERWVRALHANDTDTAWELTHPASREAIGGRAAFADDASALAEGYGAWADSDDVDYTTVAVTTASGRTPIVLLRGTVVQEGVAQERVDAVPVRSDAGRPKVDPFHDLIGESGLELHPDPTGNVSTVEAVDVYLAAGREVALLVDGVQIPTTTESADGDRQHVTGNLRPLQEGTHRVAVVIVRQGDAQARVVTYTVARGSGPASRAESCGEVAFTPDSDDLASEITATNVSCQEAEEFVLEAGARTSAVGPDRVVIDGYRCVRTEAADEPLPRSSYDCTRGAARITFVRT